MRISPIRLPRASSWPQFGGACQGDWPDTTRTGGDAARIYPDISISYERDFMSGVKFQKKSTKALELPIDRAYLVHHMTLGDWGSRNDLEVSTL